MRTIIGARCRVRLRPIQVDSTNHVMPLDWLKLPVRVRLPPRPNVPFNKVPAHRIPTLWSLYRPLLKRAPSEVVRIALRQSWRRWRGQPGAFKVKNYLLWQFEILKAFRRGPGSKRDVDVVKLLRSQKRREWKESWERTYAKPQVGVTNFGRSRHL